MITQVLGKVFGTQHERDMKKLRPLVDKINQLEASMKALSDSSLVAKTAEFKQRIANGEHLDSVLPEAFAVCREASSRVLAMRHYDVQLIGGAVLHRGNIAEMRTGEGKTLVATLPVYLNALSGLGAHVVTVNDYLAKRDAEWMGRLYKWLGLSVGIIVHELNDRQRKESYGSDITYGTNNEFGFDYLRDNMKFDLKDYVQRPHNYAIVDECDSILIDEARTPLIISGPAEESTDKYYVVDRIIPHLKRDVDFVMEEKTKTASLTDDGNTKVEKLLGIENLYDPQHIELLHHVYQGLKAHYLYKRDVEYMVRGDEIVIVDEFTGRLMPGRRWSDGLHQAIEAKEGVKVKSENQTLATITFQNYFRMYKKLSGMTGTADTEAVEFKKIYSLDVTVIPTNKPMKRIDADDAIYLTEKAKFRAIAEDVTERNKNGQPVLVGTVSIEKSESLSQFLTQAGVRHNVLNAKHHEREADFVAQAGRLGAVTIATNMAGRGTDIILGGNAEFLTKAYNLEPDQPEYEQKLKELQKQCEHEREKVVEAGGLYIVGTERHESRRIDNQLRGRSGRQGDPGESRFYLSLEDNLMRIFNGERMKRIMDTLNVDENEPITARMVTRAIESAQRRVEGHNFDIRKHLLEYDDVMNKQRSAIYGLRREVLEGKTIDNIFKEFLGELTSDALDIHASDRLKKSEWDLEGLCTSIEKQFAVGFKLEKQIVDGLETVASVHIRGPQFEANIKWEDLNPQSLSDGLQKAIQSVMEYQKEKLGAFFPQLARMILLQTIDVRWKDHLLQIDRLKEGINLRAYAQKDPLIEYKREAFEAFVSMDKSVKSEFIEKVIKVELVQRPESESAGSSVDDAMIEREIEELESSLISKSPKKMNYQHEEVAVFQDSPSSPRRPSQGEVMSAGPDGGGGPSEEPIRSGPKVGRNDPCPCGSGKKYKKCHGANE
ncbi:MAG: preprotein translocase subunit SecA [Bdellovibrionales bacterium CG10_big_fil_rev_8_21_14_0_10_45_34]|nr:MAG: preprotein translocase subunit SecA [Bdellovibrionales bacterium CG10_big_fil_rev_8_21_14_0_10_45_34]